MKQEVTSQDEVEAMPLPNLSVQTEGIFILREPVA